MTFGPEGGEAADKGAWMSIWVDDVDTIYQHCMAQGLDVTWPSDRRAMGRARDHVRHPDGHVFRISQRRE